MPCVVQSSRIRVARQPATAARPCRSLLCLISPWLQSNTLTTQCECAEVWAISTCVEPFLCFDRRGCAARCRCMAVLVPVRAFAQLGALLIGQAAHVTGST